MSNRKYITPVARTDDSVALRSLTLGTRILFYPFYLLMVLLDTISGNRAWYKKRLAEFDKRTAYTDEEFECAYPPLKNGLSIWTDVRHAVAESIGVPVDSILPTDRLSDLMRMQFPLPDMLDFVLCVEKHLGIPINVTSSDIGQRLTREGSFLDLVVAIDEVVAESGSLNL